MESVLSPGRRPENTQVSMDQWWKTTTIRHWGESLDGVWTLSIVDLKDGDVEASCADYEWIMLDKITCKTLESVQYCEDGFVDPYGKAAFSGEYDLIFFETYNGLTAKEACCACGGGANVDSLSDSLIEWKLAVYGRSDDTAQVTPSPTDAPTVPTAAPTTSVPAGTNRPTTETTLATSPTEVAAIPANGDTYIYRAGYFTTQPKGDEETMLVQNGPTGNLFIPDSFALLSFRLSNLGLRHSIGRAGGTKETKAELCIHHVAEPGAETSTYTICRLRLETILASPEEIRSFDLETYRGGNEANLTIPDSCMGDDKSKRVVEFEVMAEDTLICIDVTEMMMMPELSPEKRLLRPDILEEETLILFMIDNLGMEQMSGAWFYTRNSDQPAPRLVFSEVTSYGSSTGPTLDPTDESSLETQTFSPTPSADSLLSSNVNTGESSNGDNGNKGLYGLLALLLLIPLLIWIFLKRRGRNDEVGEKLETIESGEEPFIDETDFPQAQVLPFEEVVVNSIHNGDEDYNSENDNDSAEDSDSDDGDADELSDGDEGEESEEESDDDEGGSREESNGNDGEESEEDESQEGSSLDHRWQ